MNPIGILFTSIASGCAAGLVVAYRGVRVARDARREYVDPLSRWIQELPEVRPEEVPA